MLEVSREVNTTEIIEFPASERFIKIPIDRYLSTMVDDNGKPISAISPQIALINAVNDPQYRAIVAALSRRTGKTFISNVIGQLVTFVPNSNVLIMSPNYALSNISWDLQRGMLKKYGIELVRSNAKDKVIELSNGSTIRMGSVSQPDSSVGRSYDLILFDEAALDKKGKDVYNIQLRPTLDKLNSKVIFISTPRGKNYFYEFFMRGYSPDFPEWVSIRSDYRENPRVNSKDIEQARKSMSKAEFAQEYEADFIAMQGLIYDFDVNKQVIEVDVSKIDVYDIIAGLDVGFRDATAFCVIVTDGKDVFVVDEYLASVKTTKSHAAEIRRRMEKWNVDFTYIDSSAAQTKYDLAMNYDINCINAKKSKLDGIGYVATLVDNRRIYVDKKCIHTIAMFDNYTWDDREGLQVERPKHDDFSHMADAIRYALYSHAYNMETL